MYYRLDLQNLQEAIHVKKYKKKILDKLVTLLTDYNFRPVRKTLILGIIGIYDFFPSASSANKLMKFLNINDVYKLTSLILIFVSAYTEYRWHVSDVVMDYIDPFLSACVEAARMVDIKTQKMIQDVVGVFKKVKKFILETLQRFNESAELSYITL